MPAENPTDLRPVAASRPLPQPPAGVPSILVANPDSSARSGFNLEWVAIGDGSDDVYSIEVNSDVVTVEPTA